MPTGVSIRANVLNSLYIFGCIPVVHVLVLTVLLLGIGHVSWNFDLHFGAKPFLTTMVMNSILNGIADTIAQTVSAARSQAHKQGTSSKKEGISIEIHEVTEKSLPTHKGDLYAASPFEVERLVRFMAWGFLMAPLQLEWFQFLSEQFPITATNKTSAAIWRVLCDQIIFSPIALALFFTFMTVAEGGGKHAIKRKLAEVFASALKSNYVVWPLVQILNFRVIPLPLQLPFASTVGICWTTYLSLKNEAAD